MQRAIITGATSMLGIALIEECIKNKTPVIAIVRPGSKKLFRIPDSEYVTIVECSMYNYNELPKLIGTSGGIFYHFAWSLTGDKRNLSIERQCENIKITIDAINAASKIGCEKFIGSGSQAEYGRTDVTKIGPMTSADPTTAYGISKYSAGKLAMLLSEQLKINCIWTRVFSVYGKYDKETSMISSTINKILRNEKTSFTAAIQLWDYLYSEDAGRAFYLIGKHGRNKSVYCIGSGNAKPLIEYLNIIDSLMKPTLKMGIGDIPYNKDSVMNICADITNLTKDTGFTPSINFEEGILKTIQFMKEQNC